MIESGHKNVDRFWCDRLHDLRNLVRRADTRSVKTIGTRFGVGGESIEYRAKWIGVADQPRFATRSEHYACRGRVNRRTRGANTIDRQFLFIKRRIAATGTIFDRQSGDAGGETMLHVLRDAFCLISKTALEIRVHRQWRRFHNFSNVCQHFIERNSAVGFSAGESKARRSGGEGLESDMLQ